jgi:hypothetical protein
MTALAEASPPETPPASPGRRRRLSPRLALGGALLAVASLGTALVLSLSGGDDRTTVTGPAGNDYRLLLPDGWRSIGSSKLERLPGRPLGMLRRDDGKGLLVIRREGRPPASFGAFADELDREFERRLPDFQRRSVRALRIGAGQAWFYSYIRTRSGTAHSVVLVPADGGSYVLNTVARGGEEAVAKEIGRMIISFKA